MVSLMSYVYFPNSVPALVCITALGYAMATLGMKLCAGASPTSGSLLIGLGLICAIFAEIALLRVSSLSAVYITIVAAETLLVFAFAASFGEMLTLRQTGGAVLVVLGLVAISI